jgi:hypothetical protein
MKRRVLASGLKTGSGAPDSSGRGESHMRCSLAATARIDLTLELQLLPFGKRVEHAGR